jgi:type II secretory pathway component PulF
MPVFEYEVADPRGVLSRGRAEAESQGALILRFREQGRLVVGLRTVGAGGPRGGARGSAPRGSGRRSARSRAG